MKKIMLFATIVAMSMAVAMPANAQSRKEKKAAKKHNGSWSNSNNVKNPNYVIN